LLLLMAPMAPHITAELWERRYGSHVHEQAWPQADPSMLAIEAVTMVVQVDGKVRDRIEVPVDIPADQAEELALASAKVQAHLDGPPRRVVSRPPQLVNVVT
jgi:leucyl-tRNA synthetase